jgi:hypothetical protein
MWQWIKSLDELMRGQLTRLESLREAKLAVPALGFAVLIEWLGMIYGLCMGTFNLTSGGSGHAMQMVATTLKVPALFLLTLGVTFPSLYVFSALAGSPLRLPAALRLLISTLAIMLTTLASIGPIVCFFSFTTTSYPFMILLNVLVFAIAGLLGSAFLLQTLHRLILVFNATTESPTLEGAENTGSLDRISGQMFGTRARVIFQAWVLGFGIVGAQMAWVLRPFIGRPGQAFTWFRPQSSNFFQALIGVVQNLLQ